MGGGGFPKESQGALVIERRKINPCADLSFFPVYWEKQHHSLNLLSSEMWEIEERKEGVLLVHPEIIKAGPVTRWCGWRRGLSKRGN